MSKWTALRDLLSVERKEVARLTDELAEVRTIAKARPGVDTLAAVRALAADRDACARERDEALKRLEEALAEEREQRERAEELFSLLSDLAETDPDMPSHEDTMRRVDAALGDDLPEEDDHG